ncbi:MAG: hypothetical protein WCJ45_04550 [bacterium]
MQPAHKTSASAEEFEICSAAIKLSILEKHVLPVRKILEIVDHPEVSSAEMVLQILERRVAIVNKISAYAEVQA